MTTPPLAAFDVDGTLTTRDTFLPFLVRVAGAPRTAGSVARHGGRACLGRSVRSRDALKAAVIADLLAGQSHEALTGSGRTFADTIGERWLRTDVADRLRWHRRQGHEVALVSASLRYYLEPLADRLGAQHLVCTELEVGDDGLLTGALNGPNCRGTEKVRRLEAIGVPVFAYGDSRGDEPMLRLAATGVRVGRARLPVVPPGRAA